MTKDQEAAQPALEEDLVHPLETEKDNFHHSHSQEQLCLPRDCH